MLVKNLLITKDWNVAISGVGLFAGGVYDIGHNLLKLRKNKNVQDDIDEGEE